MKQRKENPIAKKRSHETDALGITSVQDRAELCQVPLPLKARCDAPPRC